MDASAAIATHLNQLIPRAFGRKVSDEFTVSLCRLYNRELHRSRTGDSKLVAVLCAQHLCEFGDNVARMP